MNEPSFVHNHQVKSLEKFNENYAFVMMIVFSLIPVLAIFAPPEFGPLFSGIAKLEIYGFLFLGFFQLVSYASFSSGKFTLKERMSACLWKLLNSIKNDKTGILLIGVYALCVIAAYSAYSSGGSAFDGMDFTDTRMYKGTDFRPDGVFMYTCFMVVYIYATMIKRKNLKKAVFITNIVGFILVSLVVLQQYFGIIGSTGVKDAGAFGRWLSSVYESRGIRYGHFYKGLTGSFYNLNHVAYYMTIGTMLVSGMVITSQKTVSKVMWSLLAVYSYYLIIINDTFGCYLAVIGALLITAILYIIKDKERNAKRIVNAVLPLILFVAVSVTFIATDTSDNSIVKNFKGLKEDTVTIATTDNIEEEHAGSGRLEMWVATVDMIKEKPVFGFGPDNLKSEYVERERSLDRAHNEPLEMAVATGIPSALLYYAAIAVAIYLFIRKKDSFSEQTSLLPFMALAGYLISSLFGVFLFYTGGYFIMMLGFVSSREKQSPVLNAKFTNIQRKN